MGRQRAETVRKTKNKTIWIKNRKERNHQYDKNFLISCQIFSFSQAKVNTPERREADRETENIVRIPAEKLDNFLSEPAAVLMEKLFAGRRAGVSLADLRSLNDTGDIIKVSYNSKVDENSLEIIKTLNCSNSDDIILKSVQMDCEGNMLTCKYEDITWVRDKKVPLFVTSINI